ncbi:MAG: ABC transporter permease [Oscillospiraceae bacterium]|nr:ABC transporter permease [Oscillospiraceae bacterium]
MSVKKEKASSETLVTRQYQKRGQMSDIIYRVYKNKGAMVGVGILLIMFIMLIISFFMPLSMVTVGNPFLRLTPPNAQFPFGTDFLGRNEFYRVIYGTRYSLSLGFGAAGLGAILGITLGSIAGFFGKVIDEVIMRCSDTLASIPGILLGMVIVTTLGNGLPQLIIAVGVASVPFFIRITRASILVVRNQEFVEAAHAIGLGKFRILFTQVLPNGLSPIIVMFTVILGMSIITGASLSFLGFGIPVPLPEWGSMIAWNREFMHTSAYLLTFPGVFIMLSVLSFNLIGDALRDALDPKLKR